MRPDGRRTKKLVAAFHFQFSDPAGWKCGDCRKFRLERKRGCGYLPEGQAGSPRAVWARGTVAVTRCPKPLVTAEIAAWLEEFNAWKRFGFPDARTLSAREVEAMLILEQEFTSEVNCRGQD